MTDNFLQKLEEKVMILLTELEAVRKELQQLRHENANLKADKASHAKKLQGLVALLDSLESDDEIMSSAELRVLNTHDEVMSA